MSLHVGSEVASLKQVIVHRPGVELQSLGPENKQRYLFDELLWVERAQQEHDLFVDALEAHGVEVHRLEDLLRITVPMDALVEDAEAWERGVDDLAEEDPEIAAYVAKLEEAKDTADLPEASGDAIAQEFERFLRRRDQN